MQIYIIEKHCVFHNEFINEINCGYVFSNVFCYASKYEKKHYVFHNARTLCVVRDARHNKKHYEKHNVSPGCVSGERTRQKLHHNIKDQSRNQKIMGAWLIN